VHRRQHRDVAGHGQGEDRRLHRKRVRRSSTCNRPVEPGFICSAFANGVPAGAVVACTVTANNTDKLRANLTLYDASFRPLRSVDLR
jgi:hypothetical protein